MSDKPDTTTVPTATFEEPTKAGVAAEATTTSTPVATSPKPKKERLEHLLPVTDQVPVGTAAILTSPHVSEGPGRIANSPVPSVYSDDRGEIHRLRVGHRRMNLLSSKQGVMRSGYLHPHDMSHFVVSGRVEVWTLGTEKTSKTFYGAGDFFTLAPYVPHILHFLEDTISLEFWDGQFICYYYHPYRRVVQLQNSLMEDNKARTGTHQHLVPQDTPEKSSTTPGVFWWTTGLVMGVALGIFIGHGRRK
jgi:quercetin dioxygenase-like cupin family protein